MSSEPRILLATDMDGTVIPLDRRKSRKKAIVEFRKTVRTHRSIILAYVTGRHLDLAIQGQRDYGLPVPRLLVCDVGTSIYALQGRRWIPDKAYRRMMKTQLGGHSGDEITAALQGTPDLTPQEDEKQAEFKRSYYVPVRAGKRQVLARVKQRLARKGIKASLVYSVDRQKGVGLLDILPRSVAKDFALYYLQKKLRLPADRVVFAGDSGNDLLAFASGFKAIVVGNTPTSVKRVLSSLMRKKTKLSKTVFFARHHYAKGVLEGARHFGLIKEQA
jgi:sucrose-6F-phosphate phosphohydrolase